MAALMAEYVPALTAVLFWALSAPIVNEGIRRLPPGFETRGMLMGLVVSLTTGASCLGLYVWRDVSSAAYSPTIVGAGILMFPVATGLYYLAGNAFGKRMEFAAQFSRVKPILSFVLATMVLNESVSKASALALILVGGGITCMILGSVRREYSVRAVLLGLLTAAAWSGGEVLAKLSVSRNLAIVDTFAALSAGAVLSIILIGPFSIPIFSRGLLRGRWLMPFALHGFTSFAIAYSSFFRSLATIGLARTVLVTAFWPVLGLGVAWAIARWRGQTYNLPATIVGAATLLLLGGIVQIGGSLAH